MLIFIFQKHKIVYLRFNIFRDVKINPSKSRWKKNKNNYRYFQQRADVSYNRILFRNSQRYNHYSLQLNINPILYGGL